MTRIVTVCTLLSVLCLAGCESRADKDKLAAAETAFHTTLRKQQNNLDDRILVSRAYRSRKRCISAGYVWQFGTCKVKP